MQRKEEILSSHKLRNGHSMPATGFGTWQIPSLRTKDVVLTALRAGYRLIDTAKIYGNEIEVGQAIRESGIPRKEIFVSTKLWNDDQGFTKTLKACAASMQKLQLEYLDSYLIHWPATKKRRDSWRAMEKLVADGTIRAAGVSNYTIEHLEDLAGRSNLIPAVNQVEFHPFIYEQQQPLLKYCRANKIEVQAYSPINRLNTRVAAPIRRIAKRLRKTPQQVVLKWCVEQGTVPLPRSANADHISDNFNIADITLSNEDMQVLNSLSDGRRVTWDPAGMGSS